MDSIFTGTDVVRSTRIIYTPSTFARSSLIHLQETGTLKAAYPHRGERNGLASCLFFTVLEGDGRLTYDGKEYKLGKGDCVFINCKKAYSHETGLPQPNPPHLKQSSCTSLLDQTQADNSRVDDGRLWSLKWCHFYGPNMSAIYHKYMERGGRPVFRTQQLSGYQTILDDLYRIAGSDDYVRDMRIHEKLSSLLILLMEDAWNCRDTDGQSPEEAANKSVDIQEVKEYLDSSFKQKVTIDDLAGRFYISKYYLMSLFKDRYGVTVNAYLNQLRVAYVKQNLRFTNKTVEMLAMELGLELTYLSRLFKKVEGVSPSEYRRQWSSTQDKDKT